MVDFALQHSVNAHWRGITEIAEQLRAFTQVRRTKVRTPAERITDISQGIDRVDELLAQVAENNAALNAMVTRISAVAPTGIDDTAAMLAELRKLLQDQETILRANRNQLMEFMIELNPEDAWAWESEAIAAIRQAKADADAGLVTRYESDAEFFAGLDRIYADAHP